MHEKKYIIATSIINCSLHINTWPGIPAYMKTVSAIRIILNF